MQWWGRFANRPYVDCTKLREQSENVYENKGKVKRVSRSGPLVPSAPARFDNFRGINEDGGWGTFKTRTAEILRRPSADGLLRMTGLGYSGTPLDGSRRAFRGLHGMAGQRSPAAAVHVE